ncbi:fimbria/pilus outer membrane usher protein [Shigella flexneri]
MLVIPLREENTCSLNAQEGKSPAFQQTLLHGLPAGIYGGTQLADCYRAFNFGIGKNMGAPGARLETRRRRLPPFPMTVSMTDNRCVFS